MSRGSVAGGADNGPAPGPAPRGVSGVADYLADLDPEDPRPPSRQIADHLRSAILSGRLQTDAKLPSQNQLSARYGVARETVKVALRRLASEGLIVSRKGSGSFVSATHVGAPHSPASSKCVPERLVTALDVLKEAHDEAASLIRSMPDSQQAFECSTRLIYKLRELAEVTASLRAELAVRIVSEQ